MRHEQSSIDEVNIGFDAPKTACQGVQQRPRVLVVIVRVGPDQRRRVGSLASGLAGRENREQEKPTK